MDQVCGEQDLSIHKFRKGEGTRGEGKEGKKRKQIRITCNICNSKEKRVLQTKMLC